MSLSFGVQGTEKTEILIAAPQTQADNHRDYQKNWKSFDGLFITSKGAVQGGPFIYSGFRLVITSSFSSFFRLVITSSFLHNLPAHNKFYQ